MTAVDERPVIRQTQNEDIAAYHRLSIRELEIVIGQKFAALRHHVSELERWDADSFAAALRLLVFGHLTAGPGADAADFLTHFADADPRGFKYDMTRLFESVPLPDCPDDDEDCGACVNCDYWLIRSRYDDPQADDVQAILAALAADRRKLYDVGIVRPEWATYPRDLTDRDEARATELRREIRERETELHRLAAGGPAPHARLYATGRKDGREAAK
jgi:hypothetical protein